MVDHFWVHDLWPEAEVRKSAKAAKAGILFLEGQVQKMEEHIRNSCFLECLIHVCKRN